MHEQIRIISLRETDATGVLYFAEKLKLALEAFEDYLLKRGFTLQQMIEGAEFLLPIVHAEADYSAPLRVGDQVTIKLSLDRLGTSSFTLKTLFFCRGNEVGSAKIVHVSIARKTGKSIPLPPEVHQLLSGLARMSQDLGIL